MPPGWRYDPATGSLIPPPPVAWDRPVSEPLPAGGAWGGAIFMPSPSSPAAPLHDPSAAMAAYAYAVPPRAEWPLYVKR